MVVVNDAEDLKIRNYAEICKASNLLFEPVGIDIYGGCGIHGKAFLTKLIDRYSAAKSSGPESIPSGQLKTECWERVSVAIYKAIASQLSKCVLTSLCHGYLNGTISSSPKS